MNSGLIKTNFSKSTLIRADLRNARLIETNFRNARIENCFIYGTAVWDINLDGTIQHDLYLSNGIGHNIIVDNIEVGQLLNLFHHNKRIREIISSLNSKIVLILGSFSPERKAILQAIRDELPKHNYLPIIFDFEKTIEKDFAETIILLSGLSSFIIADITNPKSIAPELQVTIPDLCVPFVPIIQDIEEPFSMFKDLNKYDWVLDLLEYDSIDQLLAYFKSAIIEPAENKKAEIIENKAQTQKKRHINDYIT